MKEEPYICEKCENGLFTVILRYDYEVHWYILVCTNCEAEMKIE